MNLNFLIISVSIFILNSSICPVVFGEKSHDEDLDNNSYLLSELNSTISESGEKSAWFLNVPLLPVIVATSNSIPEGSCKKQLQLYLKHLKNGTLWATEMFDASSKYPYGVFDGFTRHLGSYDQCEQIETKIIDEKNGKIEEIQSRYCLVDVKFKEKNEPTNFSGEHNIFFNPQDSAWEAIREKGDFRRWQRYFLQLALCFPAECQPEDIVVALKDPLDEFGENYNITVKASISPLYCSSPTLKEASFSNYEIIFCLTFFMIIIFIVISTIIDIKSDEKKELSMPKQLIYCFSARKNFNEIMRITSGNRALNSINLIRVFLSFLAVVAHRQVQYIYAGTISGQYFEWVMSTPFFGLTHNFSILVDGFFGLGGLLLSYLSLKKLNASGKLNYVRLILTRLVRLLPLFMFVTFGYATVFYRFGSGPFWEVSVGFNHNSCSSYWWTNLFFINNYFGGNNKCAIQTWYLAVDFHCYLIGLLLITVFHKMNRKIGYIFLVTTLIIFAALPFHFTYKNNADPLYTSFVKHRMVEEMDYFVNNYVKTHFRLAAYVTGLILGALIYDYENANWRLSKIWSQIFIFAAVFLAAFTMWSGTLFMNPNLIISAFIKALYASLQRPIFALSICAIPLLFTIGSGLDFYYKIVNSKWIQRLSRISFAIYLTHYALFLYELGTIRTAFTFSFYNSVKYLFGDMIYSVLLGLFFTIVIEFPFRNVGDIILKRKANDAKRKQNSC
ncbi:O-acyltransferase like protein-like isoform X2 [Leptopilina heterotoma]|uniref:O-acyltransferase like protein-like isoform X2 n=1 Tax=Leptopilina heterotoma TaxID=63436 RepID=UPI001CAA25F7|nr:O-acyltransferase like protein-like isoform X2 [Leptopilina heterotoma]